MDHLPIEDVLPAMSQALTDQGQLVLQAPPGAGKTTRVPLHILQNDLSAGKIIMLEPRRVAVRTAASHIASLLGEDVGARVGYRMRGETKVSKATRIEVVTEGILTRMIQSDPELSGIGCLIFDEFHERSLQADLGLALALEIKGALRPDLRLVVMSATLDAGPVAELMGGAPVLTSEGQNFEVKTEWLDTPWTKPGGRGPRFEASMAALVTRAVSETSGGVLVFLPGAGEIARVETNLKLGADIDVVPLYGALPFKAQLEALKPPKAGRRKVVLATSIAETSLTIPDVRVVVDGGRSRRPRFDPGSGMTRLVTERVTKAEATQRRGRAGRVAAGHCYRHWTKGEEGGMAAFPPVEIEDNDLMGLALDLALWGETDASRMPFLTQPPHAALTEAKALLLQFGALTEEGRITEHGRALAELPLHPRLGQIVLRGKALGMGKTAPLLAVLMEGRGSGLDVEADLRLARNGQITRDMKVSLKRIGSGEDHGAVSVGGLLSLGFPDRIAKRRAGQSPRYLMSGGKGAILPEAAETGNLGWLVIPELDGDGREAKARRVAQISEAEVLELHAPKDAAVCVWDKRISAVVSEVQTRLGAIVVSARSGEADEDASSAAMLEGVRAMGLRCLPWSKASRQLQTRAIWARNAGSDLPDMSDAALLEGLEEWLLPYLGGASNRGQLERVDLVAAIEAHIGWEALQDLAGLAPVKYTAPTGTGVTIDYAEVPKISIRLQEMMGVTSHPTVGRDRIPLLIELLSPAQRPIQTTSDLPGFWATSYLDVRKDMRGRYPKHHWPEDPSGAEPTRRVKHPRR